MANFMQKIETHIGMDLLDDLPIVDQVHVKTSCVVFICSQWPINCGLLAYGHSS